MAPLDVNSPDRTKICGYVVVRKPSQNYDEEGRGAYVSIPPKVDDLYYGGIDRMEWFDVHEDYYPGRLSGSLADLYRKIIDENNDFSGIEVTKDLETAHILLDYSNRVEERNEIIVVFSPKLEKIKGSFVPNHAIQWCGFDVVVTEGGQSLLHEAVFYATDAFADFVEAVNSWGLLDDEAVASRLIERYFAAAEKDQVEELDEDAYEPGGIDLLWIGRLED